jgi:hypothetical protein
MVNANTGTWLVLGSPVTGEAKITCLEILWMKFYGGEDVGKYGALSQGMMPPKDFSVSDILFGPPVSDTDAVQAAYYNLLDVGSVDSVLQVKVKAVQQGFSFLGIFGYGSSSAKVEGIGAHVSKQLSTPTPSSKAPSSDK